MSLASLIQIEMRAQGIKQFEGPVLLDAEFDYATNETRIAITPLLEKDYRGNEFKASRCDLDNLIKQIAECCQDSGLLRDDAQIAVIRARKVK